MSLQDIESLHNNILGKRHIQYSNFKMSLSNLFVEVLRLRSMQSHTVGKIREEYQKQKEQNYLVIKTLILIGGILKKMTQSFADYSSVKINVYLDSVPSGKYDEILPLIGTLEGTGPKLTLVADGKIDYILSNGKVILGPGAISIKGNEISYEPFSLKEIYEKLSDMNNYESDFLPNSEDNLDKVLEKERQYYSNLLSTPLYPDAQLSNLSKLISNEKLFLQTIKEIEELDPSQSISPKILDNYETILGLFRYTFCLNLNQEVELYIRKPSVYNISDFFNVNDQGVTTIFPISATLESKGSHTYLIKVPLASLVSLSFFERKTEYDFLIAPITIEVKEKKYYGYLEREPLDFLQFFRK